MYYQPSGKRHTITTYLHKFEPAKATNCGILEAFAEGGPVISDVSKGLSGYIWKAYIDGTQVVITRIGSDEIYKVNIGRIVSQLDLTFDQNMRPFLTYVADGLPYYYHFNSEDSTYSEIALDNSIRYPRCELDTRNTEDIPRSDIILGYIRDGNLCYRLQRERFLKERIIATDNKKTMLWRIGRLIDGRFGYQWR